MITLVAAADLGRVIGRDNALPWRLPADLKRFKALTLGHTIVMGRRTFDSLKSPLPGRDNVVLSSDPAFAPAGVRVVRCLDDALACAPDVMVIGGARVYADALGRADKISLTVVHARVQGGDAFFPEITSAWCVESRAHFAADVDNAFATTLFTLGPLGRSAGGDAFTWPRD